MRKEVVCKQVNFVAHKGRKADLGRSLSWLPSSTLVSSSFRRALPNFEKRHERKKRKRSKHTYTHQCPSYKSLLETKSQAGTGEDFRGCVLNPSSELRCPPLRYSRSSFSAWEINPRHQKTEWQPSASRFLTTTPPAGVHSRRRFPPSF